MASICMTPEFKQYIDALLLESESAKRALSMLHDLKQALFRAELAIIPHIHCSGLSVLQGTPQHIVRNWSFVAGVEGLRHLAASGRSRRADDRK